MQTSSSVQAASAIHLETPRPLAPVASLRPFFQPHAVAVVGASRDPTSIGHRLLEALSGGGFAGPIYPVNPTATEICGLRSYPSVRELPEPPDLAVIAVPRDAVLNVVDDCAARGVHALVVITAGFGEVGSEGRELQQRLEDKVRGAGMRLIGPNCLGLFSNGPQDRLNATFVPVSPPPGRLAMGSDSGALGLVVLAAAGRLELGVSSFVSVGNRADISSNDLLEYWEGDNATDAILLYLESCDDPRRFAQIASRVSRRKPIVALKAGRSRAGFRAAASHTAALAVQDVAVEALFHQTGVIRAETLEELFDLGAALECQPVPRGRRVGILTNAGGPAILCADACEAAGLSLPELSERTRTQLATFLPAMASLANPIDMIASATPEDYRRALRILLLSEEVDAVIVIHVWAGVLDVQKFLEAIQESAVLAGGKGSCARTALACLMPEQANLRLAGVGQGRIPCYAFPETPARVLGKLAAYAQWRSQAPGEIPDFQDMDLSAARSVCREALDRRSNGWLSADETQRVLRAMQLPVVPGAVARTPDEAVALARKLGFPVAVKLASTRLLHKSEVGGVYLHVSDEVAVRRAFEAIQSHLARTNQLDAMEGILVQPMISGGIEVMVGVTRDPLFGPLIAFGLGGIHVEILGDVCFRVAPLTDRDACEMVRGIRGYRLLQGYRGHPAADLTAIEEVLLRLSRFVEEVPEVVELDLNPVIALPPGQGCRIIDARMRVEAPESR